MGWRENVVSLFSGGLASRPIPSSKVVAAVRAGQGVAGPAYPSGGRLSLPSYLKPGGGGGGGSGNVIFVPLPDTQTSDKLALYKELRENVPDVSDGIWLWVRMCNSGHDVNVFDRQTGEQVFGADQRIRELAQKIDPNGGMDGLISRLLLSYFTYGAFAGEIVLNNAKTDIQSFVTIPVGTIRFGFKKTEYDVAIGGSKKYPGKAVMRAYQIQASGSDPIEMNVATFFYYGLDPDEDSPYGRSMLSSLLEFVHWQRQVIPAMSRAQLNAAWPRLHISYRPDPQKRGESDPDYKARIEKNLSEIVTTIENLDIDTNFVTFSNVDITYKQAPNPTERFYEKLRALEEQIISGMHLVPMLVGRSYGPSGTWAEAQARLMERAAVSAQLGIKRTVERMYDLALRLWGLPQYRTEVEFHKANLQETLKQSQTEALTWATGLAMRNEKIITQDQLAARMGIQTPAGSAPPAGPGKPVKPVASRKPMGGNAAVGV